ncbi:hypothetical protein PHYPSEUDO_005076 [Phytophthora pseudosyringae]|uniref:Uncharacterized protein n=1 Tax=Phytophthora pseudosyringae TaxID=221518 RepID=A0A8T1VPX9_9STRA|nr:hypothetical protein PHYPSEUDO_005076 [Phytophthora pseudosyringae]
MADRIGEEAASKKKDGKEKKAKEAEALARARASAASRSAQKEAGRRCAAVEEIRGAEARQFAIVQLEKKKAAGKIAVSKRKTCSSSTASKKDKRLKMTTPHMVQGGEDSDADDESAFAVSVGDNSGEVPSQIPLHSPRSRNPPVKD